MSSFYFKRYYETNQTKTQKMQPKDGFSGYNQIRIAPFDQHKAYNKVSIRLC